MTVDADLRARMDEFQQAVEARDATAAGGVIDADFALVLVHPARTIAPRASLAGDPRPLCH